MEAIMLVGVAVVGVGGWFSFIDLLQDMGINIQKSRKIIVKSQIYRASAAISLQQCSIKQVSGVNI